MRHGWKFTCATQPSLCSEPPPGTRIPCVSDAQCIPGVEFCLGEGCEEPGGCASPGSGDCGVILEPVCGCDGTTYTSDDCAHAKGVRVQAPGSCTPTVALVPGSICPFRRAAREDVARDVVKAGAIERTLPART